MVQGTDWYLTASLCGNLISHSIIELPWGKQKEELYQEEACPRQHRHACVLLYKGHFYIWRRRQDFVSTELGAPSPLSYLDDVEDDLEPVGACSRACADLRRSRQPTPPRQTPLPRLSFRPTGTGLQTPRLRRAL